MTNGTKGKRALEIYALAACLGALGFFAIDLNYRQRVAEGKPVRPADQIPAMRAGSWAWVLRRDRHEHLHNLVQAIIGVLVACVVFAVHWLIAGRAREAGAAAHR